MQTFRFTVTETYKRMVQFDADTVEQASETADRILQYAEDRRYSSYIPGQVDVDYTATRSSLLPVKQDDETLRQTIEFK